MNHKLDSTSISCLQDEGNHLRFEYDGTQSDKVAPEGEEEIVEPQAKKAKEESGQRFADQDAKQEPDATTEENQSQQG